jgi:poly(ADP-ribose) glycohydrolase ARH3
LLTKFQGALLGTLTGDALGMPVEGWSQERILGEYGLVDRMLDARLGTGTYTDDTEMMIALAETLGQNGHIVPDMLAKSFTSNMNKARGYGAGSIITLSSLCAGNDWTQAAFAAYPEGSMGNGACMRIAPVGVLFHNRQDKLIEQATMSARVTHAHHLAIEGARLQAMAVASATLIPTEQPVGEDFVEGLVDGIDEPAYIESLNNLLELLAKPHDPLQVSKILGAETLALRSVPAAIYMFIRFNGDFKATVSEAVSLGGDTDTVGAMAGAICGAHLGHGAIPGEWYELLENGAKGRDYIKSLGQRLYEVWKAKGN